jgi:hypothetical protein
MWLRQVWDMMFKRRSTDRSERVKTGQSEPKDDASPTEGETGGERRRGYQTQDMMKEEWKRRYERDIEALSKNWHPPDIYVFARYLREGEPSGPVELLFDHLWEAFVAHCEESNRWAMTPRRLQNEWKKVGYTRRESTPVAPRRRWYVLPDDRADMLVEVHVVTISYEHGANRH